MADLEETFVISELPSSNVFSRSIIKVGCSSSSPCVVGVVSPDTKSGEPDGVVGDLTKVEEETDSVRFVITDISIK